MPPAAIGAYAKVRRLPLQGACPWLVSLGSNQALAPKRALPFLSLIIKAALLPLFFLFAPPLPGGGRLRKAMSDGGRLR